MKNRPFRSATRVSGCTRQAGFKSKSVYALGHQKTKRIINEPVLGHFCQPCKPVAADAHREMSPFSRTGVARVQVAVVDHLQVHRFKACAQGAFNIARLHAHVLGSLV
jgi:hypothetical protein